MINKKIIKNTILISLILSSGFIWWFSNWFDDNAILNDRNYQEKTTNQTNKNRKKIILINSYLKNDKFV